MIITCPQCDTRFVVPSTVFAKGGRKVKCASCKHVWFHEEDTLQRASEPQKTSQSVDNKDKKKWIAELASGYKVIAGFAILVLAIYFAYHYLNPSLKIGEGLVFDNITIVREGESVTLKGDIVNAMDSPRGVPSIQITQFLQNNVEGDKIIIAPSHDILQSGEAIEFSAEIHDLAEDVVDLKISFFMGGAEDIIETVTEQEKEPEIEHEAATVGHHH